MSSPDQQYRRLCESILKRGQRRQGRNGGTLSVFGHTMRFGCRGHAIPMITLKRAYWRHPMMEMLWMVSGLCDSLHELPESARYIWSPWADEDGHLGPIYGVQWRDFGSGRRRVDQLQGVIDSLQQNPHSRRHIITSWDPTKLERMALPPCHGVVMQFYVGEGGELSMIQHQRSADVFIGLPWNMTFYGLFLCWMAEKTGLRPGDLIFNIGDAHLYSDHLDATREMLSRDAILESDPRLGLNRSLPFRDRKVSGYKGHPAIKVDVHV